jgi:uncharacterized membrane protein YgaE (UPF0421/DUF939 family)
MHPSVSHLAFVARCALSASLAYGVALQVGLSHPVWAPMSALIVSQERLADTRQSLWGRLLGTVLGMASAVLVDALGRALEAPMAAQIALTVALCAPLSRRRPALRVSMWTGPIVLLTPARDLSVVWVALYRGAEVMLGSLLGAFLHLMFDALSLRLLRLTRKERRLG